LQADKDNFSLSKRKSPTVFIPSVVVLLVRLRTGCDHGLGMVTPIFGQDQFLHSACLTPKFGNISSDDICISEHTFGI